MLTSRDVAQLVAVTEETARQWMRSGRLPSMRFHRQWRCDWEAVWREEQGGIPPHPLRKRYQLPLVTKADLARTLAVSPRTIERLFAQGLPKRGAFGLVRCNPVDVEDWLRARMGVELPHGWHRGD